MGHSTVRQQARHLEKVKGLRSGGKPFPVGEEETVWESCEDTDEKAKAGNLETGSGHIREVRQEILSR